MSYPDFDAILEWNLPPSCEDLAWLTYRTLMHAGAGIPGLGRLWREACRCISARR